MHVCRPAAILVALVLASGCAGVDSQLTGLADGPDDEAERMRFCLALGRALNAVEEDGTGSTAREAAEEALAQAPDELREPARTVVDHLRRAREGEGEALTAGPFTDALEVLRDGARRMCEP